MLLNIVSSKSKLTHSTSRLQEWQTPQMASLYTRKDLFTTRHSLLWKKPKNLLRTTTFGQWSFYEDVLSASRVVVLYRFACTHFVLKIIFS